MSILAVPEVTAGPMGISIEDVQGIDLPPNFTWGVVEPRGCVAVFDPNGDIYNIVESMESAGVTARLARKGYWFPRVQ